MYKCFVATRMVVCVLIIALACSLNISASSRQDISGAPDALQKASLNAKNYNSPYAKDLLFLAETLEKNHPRFVRSDFDAAVAKIIPQISGMDAVGFNLAVRRILAEMGDAHTYSFQPEHKGDRMFPIWQLKHYDDGWFIDGIHGAYAAYLGHELVAINKIPIADVVKAAAPYISHETDEWLYHCFAQEIKNAGFLKALGIIKADNTIPVTLIDKNWRKIEAKIQTYAIDDYKQYNSGAWITFPKTGRYSGDNYYFKPLNSDTLFIQYSFCNERKDCSVPEFLKQLKAELNKTKYKKVIFDLRFNTGGDVRLFQPVIDAVGEYKGKQSFDLYCLVGADTFSTGLIHAVQLKKMGAVIVGQATGGIVNFYADTQMTQLPNSGIRISYSTNYVETIPGYKGTNLLPDIKVKNMHSDIINGIDREVLAIVNR